MCRCRDLHIMGKPAVALTSPLHTFLHTIRLRLAQGCPHLDAHCPCHVSVLIKVDLEKEHILAVLPNYSAKLWEECSARIAPGGHIGRVFGEERPQMCGH